MKNITIIGSGSWGVALAIHLAKLGNNIKIWSYSADECDMINKEKICKFLPNARIPENVLCTTDFQKALENSEIVFHVTPSQVVRTTAKQYKKYITNQPVIMCSKGFEKDTGLTLTDVLKEELPNSKIGALSGPSHAEEVSIGIPTAIVVASKDDELLDLLQELLMNPNMRIYTSKDMQGVELGGALKNIIAFCAGVAVGMEMGDNTFAALITRGLVEISRLGVALGGQNATFYGLTGLGDLIVTCLSEHSRNRRAGQLIGQGKTIDEARKEVGMVIESIDNIEVAYRLCQENNLDMPIVKSVYDVLYNNLTPKDAVNRLMTRTKRSEL